VVDICTKIFVVEVADGQRYRGCGGGLDTKDPPGTADDQRYKGCGGGLDTKEPPVPAATSGEIFEKDGGGIGKLKTL